MNELLYLYLNEEFRQNNVPKYQKYFDIWVNNLTENQINYYNKLWLKL